jgi:hypothetical protein
MSIMGELKYFLGFQIKQLQEGTFISQTKYIQDIFKKFGMKNGKPIKTPMGTNGHLDLDTAGKSVDQKVYRSMIGSLLYCWGPSSSEGPQKRNLTMSSKYGLWTGTFGLIIKAYTMRRA